MDIDESTLPEPNEYNDINDDIMLPEISSENIYKDKQNIKNDIEL